MKLHNYASLNIVGIIVFLQISLGTVTGLFPATRSVEAATSREATMHARTHNMSLHPRYRVVGTADLHSPVASGHFDCQNGAAVQRCYDPQQMRRAYDITRMLNAGYKGKGSTIALIDA